jgi:5-methylcytosine-specific restriction protein B
VPSDDIFADLATAACRGLPGPDGGVRQVLEKLFGSRYHRRHFAPTAIRDAYGLATSAGDEGVPFAGLIHPDNPPSGAYGGTSVVWFPTREHGSLIDFGAGTRGLSPDEGILTRPGHRRRIASLRRYLARRGIEAWSKPDPTALGVPVPKVVQTRFPGFEHVFQRYGGEMYACAKVPADPREARLVLQAFFDLYAYERGYQVLKAWEPEYAAFHDTLRNDLFPAVTAAEVDTLLRKRRFVVLQGPPGTGKSRLADEVRRQFFGGRGMTVQFHPAFTYEDFVVGLAPDAAERTLRFDVRRGALLAAVEEAKSGPFVLHIDEINRADLGKVLGEAIYLFEPGEVGGPNARRVRLPHPVRLGDGVTNDLVLPETLFVLCTMNTADRSIANLDIAVRRRFAFVSMPPDRSVVAATKIELATQVFDLIADGFIEHAPGDALDLLPGHAYFLARSEPELVERVRYELLPLLDEYIHQGVLGPAAHELAAIRDKIEDLIGIHGRRA